MADIIQFRDYQSKSAIERAHKALEEHLNREAIEIANIAFPSIFPDQSHYMAQESDPA